MVEAPKLAVAAAKKVLLKWQGSVKDITHIIFVSCTGLMAPGIEFLLADQLALPASVQRIGINFMGCFGAFRALAVANAIALQNSRHRILIVSTELCSLHFQADFKMDTIIGNALFSDGAAAIIVGASPQKTEQSLWKIHNVSSLSLKNSTKEMTWEMSNHGFIMRLSSKIPEHIKNNINAFANQITQGKIPFDQAAWPIHPGGKAILEAIENSFNLTSEQTKSSWEILKNYGNMSSATFLFVLEHLTKQKNRFEWAIGFGFGPGLSIEGIVLKRENNA